MPQRNINDDENKNRKESVKHSGGGGIHEMERA